MDADRETLIRDCLFIAGPTAVGKTEVAIAVAEACNGEIIGADAFQLYDGLPILTARPSPEELARVPHHLIASVPLSEPYSVAHYLNDALAIVAELKSRDKTPIFAGGTGLYLRALMRGLSDAPPSDETLRADLNALPLEQAIDRLRELDPAAIEIIDLRNPRRVVRALEICLLSGKPLSAFRQEWQEGILPHGLLITRERDELHSRILARTESMFKNGVVEEVREERARGRIGPTAEQVLGWREISALLDGEISQQECISAVAQATRRYAKRQLTWFRREPTFHPVQIIQNDAPKLPSIRIAPLGPSSDASLPLPESLTALLTRINQ